MTLVVAGSAQAQLANTMPSNVNVLNLLSPFLTLNYTTAGQTTLQDNLQGSIALNNNATLAQQQLAVSDKNLLGSASNGVAGLATYGVAANLAGGLPAQTPVTGSGGAITPQQPVGGFGSVLGPIYQTGVASGTAGPLGNTVRLLTSAYNFTSSDLGVAKFYYANGTTNGISTAVAPANYTLPTYNGLPNTTDSVYDLAYGVKNTQSGQNLFGDSRPVQVRPDSINQFDSTALAGLSTNPSFPSGHTTYAYTDSILLGMLVPQEYQSMLLRASEYGNSRIVLGVHYELDIIGSRALSQYDLSQAFTNATYINNAATTGTAVDLPSLFVAAQPEIQGYLSAQCGDTVAACASSAANTANDPYLTTAANRALYQARLTYGMPTLSFAEAPAEAAPSGGPDASILLATLYGGSTTAALKIAPTGGIYGSLSTDTINQIIMNTETNALAAFYGTDLSYWARIDLYSAAGYFSDVTGTLTMGAADKLTTDVTIGDTGLLYANGTITGKTIVESGGTLAGTGALNGNVTVNAGGVLAPGAANSMGALNVTGTLTFAPGSTYNVRVTPTANDQINVTGSASLNGTVNVAAGDGFFKAQQQYTILTTTAGTTGSFANVSTDLAFLSPSLSYANDDVYLTLRALPFNTVAQTANQNNVGAALTNATYETPGPDGVLLIDNLRQLTADQARRALDQLSGEGITGAQNMALRAGSAFASSIADQTTFWRSNGSVDPNGITLGGGMPAAVSSYAQTEKHKFPLVVKDPILPAPRTWRLWGNGFGGGISISGNAGDGSGGETGRFYGGVLGLDYQVLPHWLVGVAAGGSDASFSVGSRLTSGRVTGFHAGLYSAFDFGQGFYGQGSSTFGSYDNRTTRTVAGFGELGLSREQGAFGSTEFRQRIEVGRRLDYGSLNLTPFVAMEIASLRSNGFREVNVTGGPASPALQVNGRQTTSAPAFIGARVGDTYLLDGGMVLTPFLSLAYLHEFSPERELNASFVSLPSAAFLVNGARPSRDAVQTKAGAQLAMGNGVALFADFDGEFSGISRSYSGRGGLKLAW